MSEPKYPALTKLRDRLYIDTLSGVFLNDKTERDLKTFFFHCGIALVTLTYQKEHSVIAKGNVSLSVDQLELKAKDIINTLDNGKSYCTFESTLSRFRSNIKGVRIALWSHSYYR